MDDGKRVIATTPLTPEEMDNYHRNPDTFFGAITPTPGSARTFVEKCDCLVKTYQHSKGEKVLEFIAVAKGIA